MKKLPHSMQGYKRSCNYKALNRATMIGLFITILLFIGYANNHSFTNDFVKDKQDSINTMAYDLEVAHKSLTIPSEPNKVLIEMERTLGKAKTFDTKIKVKQSKN